MYIWWHFSINSHILQYIFLMCEAERWYVMYYMITCLTNWTVNPCIFFQLFDEYEVQILIVDSILNDFLFTVLFWVKCTCLRGSLIHCFDFCFSSPKFYLISIVHISFEISWLFKCSMFQSTFKLNHFQATTYILKVWWVLLWCSTCLIWCQRFWLYITTNFMLLIKFVRS